MVLFYGSAGVALECYTKDVIFRLLIMIVQCAERSILPVTVINMYLVGYMIICSDVHVGLTHLSLMVIGGFIFRPTVRLCSAKNKSLETNESYNRGILCSTTELCIEFSPKDSKHLKYTK